MTTTIADRRQLALQRLHGGAAPSRRSHRRAEVVGDADPRLRAIPFWDVQRGPAPAAFYVLAVVVSLFVMLGLVMVLSASAATEASRGRSPYHVFNRQVVWAVIGLVGLWLAQRINLAFIRKLSIPLLVLCSASMVLPMLPGVGVTVNGARAWIMVGPFSIQPSEFLKLAVVIFASDLLMRREEVLNDVRRSLRPLILLAAFAAGACLVQGDLGSAIVMCSIVLGVAFIGGVPLWASGR